MIEFIKMKRDNSFYKSEYFYLSENNLLNLGKVKDIEGSTMFIAENYGWPYAIYHEIYNLQDYYLERRKKIQEGDIVVDLGANIGVFTRWAYSQGASKVISFEPDKRYFKALSMNSDPKTHLFNAAMSDKMGVIDLYESDHLGGSNIFVSNTTNAVHYPIRTYTLNYLFEAGLVNHIDFLKIDIEGAEQLVFSGISDANLMKVKNIAMEYHHGHLNFNEDIRTKLITRLTSIGFNSFLTFLGDNNHLQLLHLGR
jgi:FkbM family methyltransferase